jgi:type II secretory pathway component PulM
MLVAASVLLLVIVLYLFFGAYLPAKQRVARLEAELTTLYGREAQLQSQLEQQKKAQVTRDQQGSALTGERDTLLRRIDELEKELAAARAARKR